MLGRGFMLHSMSSSNPDRAAKWPSGIPVGISTWPSSSPAGIQLVAERLHVVETLQSLQSGPTKFPDGIEEWPRLSPARSLCRAELEHALQALMQLGLDRHGPRRLTAQAGPKQRPNTRRVR